MKQSICCSIFTLIATACLTGFTAESPDELSPVIAHVLTEGKTNSIPPAFARALGVSTNQPAPGKVIIDTSGGETNSFWVSLQNTNTAVIMTRKANLSWYYVTDTSGRLHHAMINNVNIYHG